MIIAHMQRLVAAAEAQAAAAVAQALIALGNALTNDEVLTWDSSDRPQAKVN
jgi:hypothetical protein